ncbi:hypothetical protein KCK34_000913 [Clostridium perfringens]|nr:hypothetical protein [Clostridium perfringens]
MKKKRNRLKEFRIFIFSLVIIIYKLFYIPIKIYNFIDILEKKLKNNNYIRVSDLFIFDKKKNSIQQIVNKEMYNYIEENDLFNNRNLIIEKIESIDFKYELINNEILSNKEISCTTNPLIYKKVLLKYIDKSTLTIDENKTLKIFQPMEKLTFINTKVLWKNIYKIKFWKYIYKRTTIKTYYFKIKSTE